MNYAFLATVFIVAIVRFLFPPRPAFMDSWPWLARITLYGLVTTVLYLTLQTAFAAIGIGRFF
jgi:hypothetical protein